MPEVACRHRPKLARDQNFDPGRLLKAAALHQTHGSIDNGFRCKPVGRSGFQAENITCQVECLTPPVGKQFVTANRTTYHLINVFRRLILAIDFLIFLVGKLGGDEACVPGHCTKLVRIGGGVGDGVDLVANNRSAGQFG